MMSTWKSFLSRLRPQSPSRKVWCSSDRRRVRTALTLERLEDRTVPAFLIRASNDGGATFLTAQDNTASSGLTTVSDLNGTVGSIAAFFTFNNVSFLITAAQSKPQFGNNSQLAIINVNIAGSFSTGGTLIIDATDTDFQSPANPTGPGTLIAELNTNNTEGMPTQFTGYADGGSPGGNIEFGGLPGVTTTGNIFTTPTAQTTVAHTDAPVTTSVAVSNLVDPYSLSARTVFTGGASAGFSVVNTVKFVPSPVQPAAIGDFVWNDTNANGIQDVGESGVPGVTVQLLDSDNIVVATTSTDANGFYLFSDLAPGTYSVQFVAPAGYTISPQDQGNDDAVDSDANTVTGITGTYTLASGETNLTVDAGLYRPAALGDFVWHDLNANGIQDTGEPGIPGVNVKLLDSTGTTVLVTTTTDANGLYLFSGLTPGSYVVQFVTPTGGYVASPANVGSNDAVDSDSVGGKTGVITLVSGQTDLTNDAGFYKLAAIGDFVWNDLNANGIQDTGESGIPGVTVKLLDSGGNVIGTTTTNGSGLYLFSNLIPGNYSVQFVAPAGYAFSPQDQGSNDAVDSDANFSTGKTGSYTLVSGQTDLTVDAGLFQAAIQIVKLTNGTNNDSAPGVHVPVGSVVTWTYLVTNPTPVVLANITVTDNQAGVTPAAVLVTYNSQLYNIGDANHDNLLQMGETWQFTATGTATAGQYTNIGTVVGTPVTPTGGTIPGATTVTASNPDNYFGDLPAIKIIKYVNGDDANSAPGVHVPVGSTLTFTYVVTNTGNVPLANVTVTDNVLGAITSFTGDTNNNSLLDLTETWTYTETSIAVAGQHTNIGTVNGQDSFTGHPVTDNNPANYFGDLPAIKIIKYVNGDDADTAPGVQVLAGSTVTFTYVVTNTGNVPLSNVTLTDDKLGLITSFTGDTNNNSLLDLTETWTYTKTATALVGQQTNVGTVNGQDSFTGQPVTDNNPANYFGYQLATIGDFVWNDLNANGIQDAGEPGVAGATVTLFTSSNVQVGASQVTGANGLYLFTGLTPGDYYVQVTPPAGYFFSPQDQGSNDAVDSDTNVVSSKMAVTTLSSGEDDRTWDAGLYQKVSVGDFVWNDLNANGIQDSGEVGINGVTLTLTGTTGSGASVTLTTTTSGNGGYLFSNLIPGSYTVTVDSSNFTGSGALVGYFASPIGQGGNPALDSNPSPTGTTPAALPGGSSDLTLDLGYYKKVSVGDFVWNDANANGIQDSGEAGINGVTLTLTGTTGSGAPVTLTTTTAGNGGYLFGNLIPGTYTVTVDASNFTGSGALVGYFASPTSQGGNPALDSNPSPTGTTPTALPGGSSDLTLDFGYYKKVSVGDFVWNDANANGIQDSGEAGINAVTLTLTGTTGSGTPVTLTTTTAGNGGYLFSNLTPGTYTVTVNASNFTGSGALVGFAASPTLVGSNRAVDSNPSPTGTTPTALPGGSSDLTLDFGYYRLTPGIDIEKTTNGPSNSNSIAPDYDNEDAANGPGVPSLTPGSAVTWTYKVTNTGNVPYTTGQVVVVDDNGTPGNTADDMSTTNGQITFLSVQSGDADNILEPGEVWLYKATGTVQTLAGSTGSPVTLTMTGNTGSTGTAGNVRTFTNGSVSVNASGFSRDKSTGAWTTGYLGSYSGGLGVTDTSEDGSSPSHTVDNVGRENYVLFEFNQNVVVDAASLGFVVTDSDLKIWIGTISNAFTSHQVLSDGLLMSLGFSEFNLTTSSTTRTANLNAGGFVGNVLVIAADPTDTTPDDQFKIATLVVQSSGPGIYENKAVVTVPGGTDSDLSHYKNSVPGSIEITKYVKPTTTTSSGGQGLTPGFWKQSQHFQFWTGYTQSQSFNTVFGVNDPDSPTLLSALQRGGGGYKALGRHAVAALLNASNPNISFAFSVEQVIDLVQNAYATNDFETAKNILAAENEKEGVDLNNPNPSPTATPTAGYGLDANTAPGLVVAVGSQVTFTYVVTNPGQVPLANVVVTDDNETTATSDDFNPTPVLDTDNVHNAGDDNANGLLDPGELWVYTWTKTVAAGQHTNIGKAVGTPADASGTPIGSPVSATDAANWFGGQPTGTGSISGKKYQDMTGNGLTVDDTPLSGVTIYLDSNNNGKLDSGEVFTMTGSTGAYTFLGLQAGTYNVREVVPAGFIRTSPTTSDKYTVTLTSGSTATGKDFANFYKDDCACSLSNISYTIKRGSSTFTVTDLRGNVNEGDIVTVNFTVGAGSEPVQLSLVSYTAPDPYFDANHASQQDVYEVATGFFLPGTHSLTVHIPCSYFQIDFVCGAVIDKLGPSGSNIFYTPQDRLISADNDGISAPTSADDFIGAAIVAGGSSSNDTILFRLSSDPTKVAVLFNGQEAGRVYSSTTSIPFTRLAGYGYGGNDTIQVDSTLSTKAFLKGGSGNDTVKGSGGNDILLGETGDDSLVGNAGRDLLIGGTGKDMVCGNADEDILVAGTTQHDANLDALDAVMKEWTRTDIGYSTRVSNLKNGTGWNGSVRLYDQTVFDDDAVDTLTGSTGSDWFLDNQSTGTYDAVKDVITDLASGEVVTDID